MSRPQVARDIRTLPGVTDTLTTVGGAGEVEQHGNLREINVRGQQETFSGTVDGQDPRDPESLLHHAPHQRATGWRYLRRRKKCRRSIRTDRSGPGQAFKIFRRRIGENEGNTVRGRCRHVIDYGKAGTSRRTSTGNAPPILAFASATSHRRSIPWSLVRLSPPSMPAPSSMTSGCKRPETFEAALAGLKQTDRSIEKWAGSPWTMSSAFKKGLGPADDRTNEPAAAGHHFIQCRAGRFSGRRHRGHGYGRGADGSRGRLYVRARRAFKGTGPHRLLLRARHIAVVHLHVHGAGGAVRVLHSSRHDSADASAGHTVRHSVAAGHGPDRQHLLRSRVCCSCSAS